MHRLSHEDGFTLVELLVSISITVLVTGAALTTFSNGLAINDSAAQLSDANENLRAGTNQLIRDLIDITDVYSFQEKLPTMSDIFISLVKGEGDEALKKHLQEV